MSVINLNGNMRNRQFHLQTIPETLGMCAGSLLPPPDSDERSLMRRHTICRSHLRQVDTPLKKIWIFVKECGSFYISLNIRVRIFSRYPFFSTTITSQYWIQYAIKNNDCPTQH